MQHDPVGNSRDAHRNRSEERRSGLQAEWDLRSEKLKRLRQGLAIESGVAAKFQLEHQIQQEQTHLIELENELKQIEKFLSGYSNFSPFYNPSDKSNQVSLEASSPQASLQSLIPSINSLSQQVQISQSNITDQSTVSHSEPHCLSSEEQSADPTINFDVRALLQDGYSFLPRFLPRFPRLRKTHAVLALFSISIMTGTTSYACSQLMREREVKDCIYYKEQYEKNNPEVNKLVGVEGGKVREKCNRVGVFISEY